MPRKFCERIFVNNGGMSKICRSRKNQFRLSQLPWNNFCFVRVNLTEFDQFAGHHDFLVKRLNTDWGASLSSLDCSTGDFRKALLEGDKRVNMGHVWAEIYALSLAHILMQLGFSQVSFDERYRLYTQREEFYEYKIWIFYSELLPPDIGGLEYMISGYLNNALFDQPFPIMKRLQDFVEYRSLELG